MTPSPSITALLDERITTNDFYHRQRNQTHQPNQPVRLLVLPICTLSFLNANVDIA